MQMDRSLVLIIYVGNPINMLRFQLRILIFLTLIQALEQSLRLMLVVILRILIVRL